jgi:hypothetical protein
LNSFQVREIVLLLVVGREGFGLNAVSLLKLCGEILQALAAPGDEQEVIAAPSQMICVDE